MAKYDREDQKNQRLLLVILIVVCMGIILVGAVRYLRKLQSNLADSAIQEVMNVTLQHRQAIDSFISADQERLHSYAEYFSSSGDAESIQRQLTMFHDLDAIYSVICLDDGWFCSSASEEIRQVSAENLEYFRSLSGSGVRGSFLGIFTGLPKFAYYETFSFSNGHKALIQKTYERNKVSETFSLSFYNGQGYCYILDQNGDILLRSVEITADRVYDNVFEALSDTHSSQKNIDALAAAMDRREADSAIFDGDSGRFVYTYLPMESVDGWYLLSIVPVEAIREESDRMMREAREAGRPYDLILLDWKMPSLDGLETARLIRKNYPEKIPILLLTAYDWGEIEQEAMEIGVDHFMPKPFFMSTFKEAIRRVMGGQKKAEISQSDIVLGKNVLVVDDIEVNRIILVKILSGLGAVCDTAGNGQEAVEKFEASQPGQYDLILMDVQMPVMDGYEATRAIRAGTHPETRRIPIIAMTANAFVEDVRDAIESGMDAHIAKPVQIDNLKATIGQVLDRHPAQVQGVEGT